LSLADALIAPDIGFRHPTGNVPFVFDGVRALLRFHQTPPLLQPPHESKTTPFTATRPNNAAIGEGGRRAGDRFTCGAGRLSSQKAQQSSAAAWSQDAAGGGGGEEGAALAVGERAGEERRRAA